MSVSAQRQAGCSQQHALPPLALDSSAQPSPLEPLQLPPAQIIWEQIKSRGMRSSRHVEDLVCNCPACLCCVRPLLRRLRARGRLGNRIQERAVCLGHLYTPPTSNLGCLSIGTARNHTPRWPDSGSLAAMPPAQTALACTIAGAWRSVSAASDDTELGRCFKPHRGVYKQEQRGCRRDTNPDEQRRPRAVHVGPRGRCGVFKSHVYGSRCRRDSCCSCCCSLRTLRQLLLPHCALACIL